MKTKAVNRSPQMIELHETVLMTRLDLEFAQDQIREASWRYRDAVRAYVNAVGSKREAARQLGISEGAVRDLLRRDDGDRPIRRPR